MGEDIYSVFNIDGYGSGKGLSKIPNDLEDIVRNDFDIEGFKRSLQEHQKHGYDLHKEIINNSAAVDDFNSIIKRVSGRGSRLKPFNHSIIRALKYGESKFMSFSPVRKLLFGKIEGCTTEDLVNKYCSFFEEQAEDFGDLFYHVVKRENSLLDYNNDLLKRDQFYTSKSDSIECLIESGREEKQTISDKIVSVENISETVKNSLLRRVNLRHDEMEDSKKILGKLINENGGAVEEVDGLIKWCSGMKNVLALAKERMDNYSSHMKETMVTYLQATSLNKSFKETNSAVRGLVEVISTAQTTADQGIDNIIEFIRRNGIYQNPSDYRGLF
tara:strand:- start:2163 stop:3152 length:990 start_codon:yes stop_codon:yes gene_type:complete